MTTKESGHERFMRIALDLARRGEGAVSPNPMVGAVVVKNGKVVGRGFHRQFGGPHAEVHAIRDAGRAAQGSTVYVNLEPCCYHGKTPPCTDLLIRTGVKHVVFGIHDPNPRVAGKGARALRDAGIRVTTGVLKEECNRLNRAFIKGVMSGLPFITLKSAQTLDGYIADTRGKSRWITGKAARMRVHAMRSVSDAVVVGAGTVRADNPRLTVRHTEGRSPLRIVVDGKLSASISAEVFKEQSRYPTIVFCAKAAARSNAVKRSLLERRGVSVYPLPAGRDGSISLRSMFATLYRLGIGSVLVEGGSRLFSQLVELRLVDRICCFVAPGVLQGGIAAFAGSRTTRIGREARFEFRSIEVIGDDLLIIAETQ